MQLNVSGILGIEIYICTISSKLLDMMSGPDAYMTVLSGMVLCGMQALHVCQTTGLLHVALHCLCHTAVASTAGYFCSDLIGQSGLLLGQSAFLTVT